MRLIKHLKIKEQSLSRFSVFLCFQIITHVSFQLTMFDGKHFVPHMGISRTKYEYQKVNRILEARTSTDHRKRKTVRIYAIGVSKECLRHRS